MNITINKRHQHIKINFRFFMGDGEGDQLLRTIRLNHFFLSIQHGSASGPANRGFYVCVGEFLYTYRK